jgi:hypothetical protein
MGSPKAVFLGEDRTGFRVEYVQTKRLLRITGWKGAKQVIGPVEQCFTALIEQLGLAMPPDTGPFLMFGGAYAEGGSRDLQGVFPDLRSAKAAFTTLRQASLGGWGEVVHVDRGKLVQDCWFGRRDREPRRGRLRRA